MQQLQKIETITALDVYKCGNAESLIGDIEKEVRSFAPDVSSAKSRKEIASLAHKVSRSKTLLDGLGKDLVTEWKTNAKAVDNERKLIRDRLDALRDEVRKPLTDWEEAEKARIAAEQLAKEIESDWDAALAENDLFDRQREIERKEEEIRLAEEAKIEAARIEREEKERIERDAKIAQEAADKARIEAEAKAKAEKERAEQEIINAKAAAELEKQRAIEAAKQAEIDKLQAIKDAEDRVKQKAEADRLALVVSERIAKAEADKKAANRRHQSAVNNKILAALKLIGIDEKTGKELIKAIATKTIDNLRIDY